MTKYSNMTDNDFDRILTSLLDDMKASELLSIGGIYEIVSEEYNNDVLDIWAGEQEEKKEEEEEEEDD